MTFFDLLFLLLAAAAFATLLAVGIHWMRGRRLRALQILRRLGICAAVYMAVVVAVSAASPREVFRVGQERCFDDWCITVQSAVRDTPSTYDVTLLLASHAKRVAQGEAGTVGYLTDSSGRRYDPIESHVPFNTLLEPGGSAFAKRRFSVPADSHGINFIYTHEGDFPIGWFIIGENHWIHGPGVVPLD